MVKYATAARMRIDLSIEDFSLWTMLELPDDGTASTSVIPAKSCSGSTMTNLLSATAMQWTAVPAPSADKYLY